MYWEDAAGECQNLGFFGVWEWRTPEDREFSLAFDTSENFYSLYSICHNGSLFFIFKN